MFVKTPKETDPHYFRVWQGVSLALQRRLRTWVPEAYFRKDITRYEDREAAYPWVVYEACRVCHGRPRTEFTYDIADPTTLPAALQGVGRAMQTALSRIEKQLYEAGRPPLARRYAPVWHQDILNAVRKKPRKLVRFLACESAMINALIDWGTVHSAGAEKRFLKTVNSAARVYGVDAAQLRATVLEETARVLALASQAQPADGADDFFHGGDPENLDVGAAGSPDGGIG
jgi:hypothetical protein